MRYSLFIPFLLLLLVSCKPKSAETTTPAETTETPLQALEKQVMAVHDDVMPRMKEMTELSAQLRAIKSATKEDGSGKLNYPEGLEQVSDALKLAEQGMWDWMKAFSDTKATLKEDQLEAFYQKEMLSVTKVRTDMLSSIVKAKEWIEAYQAKQ